MLIFVREIVDGELVTVDAPVVKPETPGFLENTRSKGSTNIEKNIRIRFARF